MAEISYKTAGVDVRKAESFVKAIKGFCNAEGKNRVSAFGSIYDFSAEMKKLKHPVLVSSTDGVGTKLKIAQDLNVHRTIGIDLVAMNVNDIVCLGAKPLFFLDYIACGRLNKGVLTKVVRGIAEGLDGSGCVLLGGETAEMPGMYKKDEYDLAGFSVGVVDKSKIVDGRNIKAGDAVIGLESSGFHSNGYSLVRKVFSKAEIKKYSKEILAPTCIYVKPILSLLFAVSHLPLAIKGIAHNTGGAFYNKITKILPQGLGFKIDRKSWDIPQIFGFLQNKARISEKEMYSTFNMGIGMIVVTDKKYAERTVKFLAKKHIKAYVIGRVIKSKTKCVLV